MNKHLNDGKLVGLLMGFGYFHSFSTLRQRTSSLNTTLMSLLFFTIKHILRLSSHFKSHMCAVFFWISHKKESDLVLDNFFLNLICGFVATLVPGFRSVMAGECPWLLINLPPNGSIMRWTSQFWHFHCTVTAHVRTSKNKILQAKNHRNIQF